MYGQWGAALSGLNIAADAFTVIKKVGIAKYPSTANEAVPLIRTCTIPVAPNEYLRINRSSRRTLSATIIRPSGLL